MDLFFFHKNLEKLINKVFDLIPGLCPGLKSVQIKGDQEQIPLPFYSQSTMEKSMTFIYDVLMGNSQLSLVFISKNERINTLSFYISDHIKVSTDLVMELDDIKYLYPLKYKKGTEMYYSSDYGLDRYYDYTKSCEEHEIDDKVLGNYHFSLLVQSYRSMISFKKIDTDRFSYHYERFLPEKIDGTDFIKLLIITLSKQFKEYSKLRFLKHSDELSKDMSQLKEKKQVFFELPGFDLSVGINPTEKIITLNHKKINDG